MGKWRIEVGHLKTLFFARDKAINRSSLINELTAFTQVLYSLLPENPTLSAKDINRVANVNISFSADTI